MPRSVRAVLLAVLAVALVACGGGQDPEQLLARSPDALEEQGTVGYDQTIVVTDDGGEVVLDTRTEGRQDLQRGAARMVMHLGELAGGDTLEVLVDDTIAYVHSPQLETLVGAQWARFDLTEMAGQLPGFEPGAQEQTGPLGLLRQLRGAADDVEELGEEEVRGVRTRHLRVTIDTQRAIEQADEDTRESLRRAVEQLGVPDRYPMELWLDEDALPRRIVTVTQDDDPTLGSTTREMRTELYDFGEPVDVSPPDPDQVVDFGELLSQLGSPTDDGA
ncbi:hypothetical protein [Egicoccus sp. AB-alg2]|uniref:hypothetical protein n=1 Tax=Egicoccus sp. AB-alg2 TaxID=3242693 RepID=UPI00359E1545